METGKGVRGLGFQGGFNITKVELKVESVPIAALNTSLIILKYNAQVLSFEYIGLLT